MDLDQDTGLDDVNPDRQIGVSVFPSDKYGNLNPWGGLTGYHQSNGTHFVKGVTKQVPYLGPAIGGTAEWVVEKSAGFYLAPFGMALFTNCVVEDSNRQTHLAYGTGDNGLDFSIENYGVVEAVADISLTDAVLVLWTAI